MTPLRTILIIVLLVVGLAQMIGSVLIDAGWERIGTPMRAVAGATGASPAPKVFSAVQGLETYSTRFYVEWDTADGRTESVELTPEVYARMRGPYNRRNVYGAALAYGPVLAAGEATRPMYEAVARAALCGEAPLLRELGIDAGEAVGPVRVRLVPLEGTDLAGLPDVLEAPCD